MTDELPVSNPGTATGQAYLICAPGGKSGATRSLGLLAALIDGSARAGTGAAFPVELLKLRPAFAAAMASAVRHRARHIPSDAQMR